MDMRGWKNILLQWITECGFMERSYLNIEQSDLDAFYQNFCQQHPKISSEKCGKLCDFLKEYYPTFECHVDDENSLSSSEYIYVYSVLLHFCCLRHPLTMFHEICQRLPEQSQQCIALFFKELLNVDNLTKEALRHAIAQVVSTHLTSPRLNESNKSGLSVGIGGGAASNSSGSLSSPVSSQSYLFSDSPLKTPKRPPRVSPNTPKSYLLEERTRELYNLRAQLETERYEKGLLEVQITQNENEIHKLNLEHKRLVHEIQVLKNDSLVNSSGGNSPSENDGEDQIRKRLLEELAQNERELSTANELIRTLQEENSLVKKKLSYAHNQIEVCMGRIGDLELKVDEMNTDIKEKMGTIKELTESKHELQQFMDEIRNKHTDLNTSSDCFDGSFARNICNTNTSSNVNSPENLGISVVDVQLREKEHENSKLKEELEMVKDEHKKLAQSLQELAEKQAKEFDIVIETNHLSDIKNHSDPNNGSKEDPMQQFNIFSNCMAKISSYHKSEIQKIKELEKETQLMQNLNRDLNVRLENLTLRFETLRESHKNVEKINLGLLTDKTEMQLALDNCKIELQSLQAQKREIVNEITNYMASKDFLIKNMDKMRQESETLQATNQKLIENSKTVEQENQKIKVEMDDLLKNNSSKINELNEQIQYLTEKMKEQSKEIESYILAEHFNKLTNEKISSENAKLKEKSHETLQYLDETKGQLCEKQKDIKKLSDEVTDMVQKNKTLKSKLNKLMEEHDEEKKKYKNLQSQSEMQIGQLQEKIKSLELNYQEEKLQTQAQHNKEIESLKDNISNLQLSVEESNSSIELRTKEKQEIEKLLNDIMLPNIKNLLKLLNVPIRDEKCSKLVDALVYAVENFHQNYTKSLENLKSLESERKNTSLTMELLTKELNEKTNILMEQEYKLEKLRELEEVCQLYESNIADLKDSALEYSETVKKEFVIKEQEFSNCMRQACEEYEASLERIRVELVHEKEHNGIKEKELLTLSCDYNDVKKKLNAKEVEVEKLKEQNNKMKALESRVTEYIDENNKLQKEIESFKQEVNKNAIRLLEADNALSELMYTIKDQEEYNKKWQDTKTLLEERDQYLKMQQKIEQDLKEQLVEQEQCIDILSEEIKSLTDEKENLTRDYEEQLRLINEEKTMLLESLKNSADQLKHSEEGIKNLNTCLDQKYQDVKEQLDDITLQNTKMQADLVEREAELRMAQEEHVQELNKLQTEIAGMQQELIASSQQIEVFDIALTEILTNMENNFNLSQELPNDKEFKNIFNVQEENEKEGKLKHLRQNLNLLLHWDQKLREQLNELQLSVGEKLTSADSSKKMISDLQSKIKDQHSELSELRKQIENEDEIICKRVAQKTSHLDEVVKNMEEVNNHLSSSNANMQEYITSLEHDLKIAKSKLVKIEHEKNTLKEEVCVKTTQFEKQKLEEKKKQLALKEKSHEMEKLTEKLKHLETQQKDKTNKLHGLEKELQTYKEKSTKQQQKIAQLEKQIESHLKEQIRLNDSIKHLQMSNDFFENEVTGTNIKLMSANDRINELQQSLNHNEQQLEVATKKVDELETLRLNSEAKCERITSESQQLERDIAFLKAQQQLGSEETQRLTKEIESLKQDKQHLREEIRDTKSDLQRANDNVSRLIQQIASIRLEKEAVIEENTLLRKQLEISGKHYSSSETQLKSIIDSSQDFERKLLSVENELKSAKAILDKSELNNDRLLADNKKLRDTQETSTKRIEKLALKLGDAQARATKLERENEKLAKTLEANTATVQALQKEKDLLQNEAKSLKERVTRAERSHELLVVKVKNLELSNSNLLEIKQKLEAADIESKLRLNKLDKLREGQEEKIRKLTNCLNAAENNNVKLNLEIGALNSQLQENKALNMHDQELKDQLYKAQEKCLEFQDQIANLRQELDLSNEEKSNYSDQLSKALLNLEISKEQQLQINNEMEQLRADLNSEIVQLRADILIMREEKSQIELSYKSSEELLKNMEIKNENLQKEYDSGHVTLEKRLLTLEEKLLEKTKEVDDFQHEINCLKESSESHSALLQKQETAVHNQIEDLEELRSKLSLANKSLEKEEEIIAQLKLDNQILHTKYKESKQKAVDAAKNSEERIKENRLELEGKLEKMKNKMKTLYTEEITKMKTKQERELAVLKSEKEVIKAQNTKYEEHTRKLSNQIVRLNDNILEYQKENAILSTKLKHLAESHDMEKFKRPNSIHVSSSTSHVAGPNIGANLAMEDEEGEIFNNTYLTDMKEGRMSEYMSREICVEEIKYRNSMLPPHLKSSYAVQFDHDCPEDELKDGRHSMDDSMCALLSTTSGGTRKKCSGVTHYKRPGPPTPSKNGRLSFGGICSEPAREILKETCDVGNGAVSSTKTPTRFKAFTSRFSLGNGKDENPVVKPEPMGNVLIKDTITDQQEDALKKLKNAAKPRLLSAGVCTSTPRKSNSRFDQRRLLSELLTSSPSPSPLTLDQKAFKMAKKISPPDVSIIETPLTSLLPQCHKIDKAPSRKQTKAKRIEAIAVGFKNRRRNSSIYGRRLSRRVEEICTPTSGDTTSSAKTTGFSNTPKEKLQMRRRQTIDSITATTSTGGLNDNKNASKQRCLRKKVQKEKTIKPRPSLHLRGTMFVKYRKTNKDAQHKLNRFNSRTQRREHFNQGRNIKSLRSKDESSTDEEDEETIIKNLTYDIRNNNLAQTFNRNDKLLGKTIIVKKEAKSREVTFKSQTDMDFEEEEWNQCIDDYDDKSEEDDEIYDFKDYNKDEQEDIDYDKKNKFDHKCEFVMSLKNTKYAKKQKEQLCKQDELVTSQDLEEFDRFISETAAKQKKQNKSNSSTASSEHFEKLLLETESSAPFRINDIVFESSSQRDEISNDFETCVSSSELLQNQLDLSIATPHISPNDTTPGHLSRTIYGGTVIYNRRLPNINTTYVRKSSIYIKNKNKNKKNDTTSSDHNDVVLITNQTITLMDLAHMWRQMDNTTRLIISFAALASLTTLLGILLSFCHKAK